jgi:hypothetical protein
MEVESIVSALEKYLREFIVYLVKFFKPSVDDEVYDDHENYNKSVIFAIFSTAIGAYLWNRYIAGGGTTGSDIFGIMVDNFLKWISFGVLLFLVIKLFVRNVPIVRTVISVVKVFSVAHVIGIYMAYVSLNTFWLFSRPEDFAEMSTKVSISAAYLIELAILWFYLPREIREMVGPGAARWRRWAIDGVYLTLISILVLTPMAMVQNDQTVGSVQAETR